MELTGLLDPVVASPWLYVVVFAAVVLDAFLPVVPSETIVITAGMLAASGESVVWAVAALAALGALIGDHISYRIGTGANRWAKRLRRRRRRGRALAWAQSTMRTRGGRLLVAARFIPGGRTATTMGAGAMHFPKLRFFIFVAIAAGCWAAYATGIGFWGGSVLEGQPVKALLLGLGTAVGVALLAELANRWWAARTHRRREPVQGSGLVGRGSSAA